MVVPWVSLLIPILFCFHARGVSASNPSSGTISVDNNGTVIAYTDSGAPPGSDYITVFGVNGLGFNANVFQRIQPVAVANGVRFVGVNRRGYGGSTPLSDAQANVVVNGTQDERDALWLGLGLEFLTFLDTFMQEKDVPTISDDGKTGGAVLAGWSFGNILTLPAVASIQSAPPAVQSRLAARIRTLILQEPASNALGMAAAPLTWVPETDPQFSAAIANPAFAQWVTAYFDHGDLATRDPNILQYILPSFNSTPSIFNAKPDWFDVLELGDSANLDFDIVFLLAPQLFSGYVNSIFNQTVRNTLPNMSAWFFTGTRSPAFAIFGLWTVQDNATTFGGDFISFHENPDTNHFIFWDEPLEMVNLYKELSA